MDNIIDLDEYRSKLAEQEIENLRTELKEMTSNIAPILPDPKLFSSVYDESYLFDSSFSVMSTCPHCGHGYGDIFSDGDDNG